MKPDAWDIWFPRLVKVGALAGIAFEALTRSFDRPYLLALYGAMLGLGEVLSAAVERRRNGNGKTE